MLNGNFLYLSCPSATFPLQYGGFIPREWLAAKTLSLLGIGPKEIGGNAAFSARGSALNLLKVYQTM